MYNSLATCTVAVMEKFPYRLRCTQRLRYVLSAVVAFSMRSTSVWSLSVAHAYNANAKVCVPFLRWCHGQHVLVTHVRVKQQASRLDRDRQQKSVRHGLQRLHEAKDSVLLLSWLPTAHDHEAFGRRGDVDQQEGCGEVHKALPSHRDDRQTSWQRGEVEDHGRDEEDRRRAHETR